MKKRLLFLNILTLTTLVLTACNLPSQVTPTSDPNIVFTAAAQTVEANLTQAALLNPPTIPVIPTSTIAPPTVTLAVPTVSTLPVATATQTCDKADFVADVTVPDGTEFNPGETFTKTWRLKNTGTCSWTPSYSVVFSSGESMSGPASQALTGNVNPGSTLDISVVLKAPTTPGEYTGYWKLRNAAGQLFATFFVVIKVKGSSGGTPLFAVTSVTYTMSTWNDASHTNCPRVIANITTNAAGTVTFKWRRMDTPDGGATQTLTFASAGTQSVNYDWARGSTWNGTATWVGVYIDNPNHQNFGQIDFTTACTTP